MSDVMLAFNFRLVSLGIWLEAASGASLLAGTARVKLDGDAGGGWRRKRTPLALH